MGFLDRLLGRESRGSARPDYGSYQPPAASGWKTAPGPHRGTAAPAPGRAGPRGQELDDAAAVERYRYLLRTAPPDAVEQAHREAFAQLTPQQRQQVLVQLGNQVPDAERARSDDPQALARMATRAEIRRPGTLERTFGGGMGGAGIGAGGLIAGSLLASVAGAFVGTAIADAMFDFDDSGDLDTADGSTADDTEVADAGEASGLDSAGGDFGGGDFGGSDFGGGDFGGGFGGDF